MVFLWPGRGYRIGKPSAPWCCGNTGNYSKTAKSVTQENPILIYNWLFTKLLSLGQANTVLRTVDKSESQGREGSKMAVKYSTQPSHVTTLRPKGGNDSESGKTHSWTPMGGRAGRRVTCDMAVE